jgi:hypothetical protein
MSNEVAVKIQEVSKKKQVISTFGDLLIKLNVPGKGTVQQA